MSPRISVRKRYYDALLMTELANLPLVFTNVLMVSDRPGAAGRKTTTARKTWRWPEPQTEEERNAALKAFGTRLRERFPARGGSGTFATIPLSSGPVGFADAAEAYAAAALADRVLAQIAAANESGGALPRAIRIWQPESFATIEIGPDGAMTPVPDFLTRVRRALDGCDARRIRQCPICLRLFVALRSDRWACSARCTNARRQRLHRSEKYRTERAQRRRAARIRAAKLAR